MKRRILLVDDEVAVLLTLKAVLEISGFDVDTAASAREGKHKVRTREYEMVISDMRMEHDESGVQVIEAARSAAYAPAVALLTAFPVAEDDWQDMGADKMLVKPMQTRVLLQQIEKLLVAHQAKKAKAGKLDGVAAGGNGGTNDGAAAKVAVKAAGSGNGLDREGAASAAAKKAVKVLVAKKAGAKKSAGRGIAAKA